MFSPESLMIAEPNLLTVRGYAPLTVDGDVVSGFGTGLEVSYKTQCQGVGFFFRNTNCDGVDIVFANQL